MRTAPESSSAPSADSAQVLHLIIATSEVADVRGQLGRGRYRSGDAGRRGSGSRFRPPGARIYRTGRYASRRFATIFRGDLVLGEHVGIELAQLGTGINAELIGDETPCLPVSIERLRVTARAIKGSHQQQPQTFPERMIGKEPTQLLYDLGVAAAGELRRDPELGGIEAEFGQPFGLRLDQRRRRDVSQRASMPEHERLGELARRALRIAGREHPPAVADHGLEQLGVGIRRADAQEVTGSPGDQEGTVRVAQEPTQPEYVDADEVGRFRGRCVPPDLVDQRVGRDDLPRVDQQGGQDRTPFRRADPPPVFSGPDLKRSEQPEPHHYPGSLASG